MKSTYRYIYLYLRIINKIGFDELRGTNAKVITNAQLDQNRIKSSRWNILEYNVLTIKISAPVLEST